MARRKAPALASATEDPGVEWRLRWLESIALVMSPEEGRAGIRRDLAGFAREPTARRMRTVERYLAGLELLENAERVISHLRRARDRRNRSNPTTRR